MTDLRIFNLIFRALELWSFTASTACLSTLAKGPPCTHLTEAGWVLM